MLPIFGFALGHFLFSAQGATLPQDSTQDIAVAISNEGSSHLLHDPRSHKREALPTEFELEPRQFSIANTERIRIELGPPSTQSQSLLQEDLQEEPYYGAPAPLPVEPDFHAPAASPSGQLMEQSAPAVALLRRQPVPDGWGKSQELEAIYSERVTAAPAPAPRSIGKGKGTPDSEDNATRQLGLEKRRLEEEAGKVNASVDAVTTRDPALPCEDEVVTGVRFKTGLKASCSDLINYCKHSTVGFKVLETCPKTCGQCHISTLAYGGTNATRCSDLGPVEVPEFTVAGSLARCSDLKIFCKGHPDSPVVRYKCQHTCDLCKAPTTETTTVAMALQQDEDEEPEADRNWGCVRRRRWGFCSTRRRRMDVDED